MSLRKSETLGRWTLLDTFCLHFWAWLLNTVAITPKSEDKYVQKCSTRQSFIFPKWHSFKIGTLVDFWRFPRIHDDLRNMITKLFWFSYQCRPILWSQQRIGKNGGKNHKSTSNAMSNGGSCIDIIDRSHGDWDVSKSINNFKLFKSPNNHQKCLQIHLEGLKKLFSEWES